MFDESLLKIPIYQVAFTHRSFLNESSKAEESNERLEFLGDSVLSLIISSKIYHLRPKDTEGSLTNLRSYIVRTTSLARAAKKLNLGKYLIMSKGEEQSGGRENPQLLANTYEALLGAIFINQGLTAATKHVEETLLPLFQNEIAKGPPKDAKSLLQEILQNKTKESPQYKILSAEGPDHAKEFVVGVFSLGKKIGDGRGASKQIAEEKAAEQALSIFE